MPVCWQAVRVHPRSEALLKRFHAYRGAGTRIEDENGWAWEMYRHYYHELNSGRQLGFQKLFWEPSRSSWGRQSVWAEHSLLARFHNETWGGEKVFSILARLQHEPHRYGTLFLDAMPRTGSGVDGGHHG
ncbi:DotU family type IV/VI secretion system protein [Halomonas elongata]|uniref:DotU family type IV/VI secretion system protein n=1 Tax=Halomonas elongata TaxID=2746 RepID=UPI002E284E81|nr:DotU family type IV/VI secretion system protein [Halomonas elongata]WVI73393.1 DotU family type IV/VI secretion system protein [Halomonas elongata]